jgi:flotillin
MIASLPSSSHPLFPLFAADGPLNGAYVGLAVICMLVAVVVVIVLAIVARFYKRCPSNRVLVIYGKAGSGHEAAHCIHGGAKLVLPLVQDYAWLSLEPMQIEIPLRGALSMENIRVNVPSVFTVAVGTTPEQMQNAAIRLLGLSNKEVQKQA